MKLLYNVNCEQKKLNIHAVLQMDVKSYNNLMSFGNGKFITVFDLF